MSALCFTLMLNKEGNLRLACRNVSNVHRSLLLCEAIKRDPYWKKETMKNTVL